MKISLSPFMLQEGLGGIDVARITWVEFFNSDELQKKPMAKVHYINEFDYESVQTFYDNVEAVVAAIQTYAAVASLQ